MIAARLNLRPRRDSCPQLDDPSPCLHRDGRGVSRAFPVKIAELEWLHPGNTACATNALLPCARQRRSCRRTVKLNQCSLVIPRTDRHGSTNTIHVLWRVICGRRDRHCEGRLSRLNDRLGGSWFVVRVSGHCHRSSSAFSSPRGQAWNGPTSVRLDGDQTGADQRMDRPADVRLCPSSEIRQLGDAAAASDGGMSAIKSRLFCEASADTTSTGWASAAVAKRANIRSLRVCPRSST